MWFEVWFVPTGGDSVPVDLRKYTGLREARDVAKAYAIANGVETSVVEARGGYIIPSLSVVTRFNAEGVYVRGEE